MKPSRIQGSTLIQSSDLLSLRGGKKLYHQCPHSYGHRQTLAIMARRTGAPKRLSPRGPGVQGPPKVKSGSEEPRAPCESSTREQAQAVLPLGWQDLGGRGLCGRDFQGLLSTESRARTLEASSALRSPHQARGDSSSLKEECEFGTPKVTMQNNKNPNPHQSDQTNSPYYWPDRGRGTPIAVHKIF